MNSSSCGFSLVQRLGKALRTNLEPDSIDLCSNLLKPKLFFSQYLFEKRNEQLYSIQAGAESL
jgi:hypothetical protein